MSKWKAHVLMGVVTVLGAWLGTAGIRFVAAQSYWTLALDVALNGLWWSSLYLFKDWDDFRRLAPTIIVGSQIGTFLGLTWPSI